MHITEEHILVDDSSVKYRQTPNKGGEIVPRYIVVHKLQQGADIERFFDPDSLEKDSVHLVINSSDDITQLAPFNVKVWHAGASYWQGHHGMNNHSIGVAITNNNPYFTALRVLQCLVARYNIRDIVNAHMIAPYRVPKEEAYDVSSFTRLVHCGNADSVGRFVVSAPSYVEVRNGPDVRFEASGKLRPGDGVKVVNYDPTQQWALVLYQNDAHESKRGWVHESNLKRQ